MAGKIIIDTERCKGCGLCVVVCPKAAITISNESNKNGYYPAQTDNEKCTGCTQCAIVCPDAAIVVLRDEKIVAVGTGHGKNSSLVKEKK